jgi:hypothetical protein
MVEMGQWRWKMIVKVGETVQGVEVERIARGSDAKTAIGRRVTQALFVAATKYFLLQRAEVTPIALRPSSQTIRLKIYLLFISASGPDPSVEAQQTTTFGPKFFRTPQQRHLWLPTAE